jgi:hypothetical protein
MRRLSLSAWICIVSAMTITTGIAFNQSRSTPAAIAAQGDPVLDGAIAAESQRLKTQAGQDSECIAQSAAVIPQSVKDKAIVNCFLGRLRQENRDAMGRELFRMKALEVAGDG